MIDGGGDYVLAVKQNQPKLYKAIESFFESHWANNDSVGGPCHHSETHEQGHGRAKDRCYYLAKIPDNESVSSAWLRRFAIGLLKWRPSSHSIKGKVQIAGWNNDFLLQVLTGKGA